MSLHRVLALATYGVMSLGVASASTADDEVFGLTRVWQIHLHITAENWAKMQPAGGGGFPGFGPPPGNPGRPGGNPGGKGPGGGPGFRPGSFGFEFEYARATVEFDGEAFADVGLRFKGNGTYMMAAQGRKRPFKIDFNRFDDDQRFHGLQQLNLHNGVMDPTHLRQTLAYRVFAEAGIPAPRTAFAEVTLTIDGECDREPLGLYTVVEEIDKAFLRRHYGDDDGMLLKPEGVQGLEYKGEDWADYAWFEPKSEPSEQQQRRLIDVTRLVHQADDDTFRSEISDFLDLDKFARFLAANTLLSNMDSFLTQVHNYNIYLPTESDKFEFLPWDMDLAMGAFFLSGTSEQLQDLSIAHPHVGENKVLDRLLAWDEFNQVYRAHLSRLTEACFGENGTTTQELATLRAELADELDREAERAAAQTGGGGFGPFGRGGPSPFANQPPLEVFLSKRRESVVAQLEGRSTGTIPATGFGGPGGGGNPGGPGGRGFGNGPRGEFGPGQMFGPRIVAAADDDGDRLVSRPEFVELGSRWLREWDADADEALNARELTAGLNKAFGPPADAPPQFRPPEGFGPGNLFSAPLLGAADKDANELASLDEWTGLFMRWSQDWDTSGDERLDDPEIAAGFNAAFVPAAGFGPPGGAPGANPAPGGRPAGNQRPPTDDAANATPERQPTPVPVAANVPEPVTLTTQEDHRQMLGQLGITKLRPGPSGNESEPNHANYDESLANPYPELPPLLTCADGHTVVTSDDWWQRRRPEIVEDFEREVYGRIPENVPAVTWEVIETRESMVGAIPVVENVLAGRVDNSGCQSIEVVISMTLTLPKGISQPVPVLMMFGFNFGGRGGPGGNRPGRTGVPPMGPSRTETLLSAGWGCATIVPTSYQADDGAGLTRGIIGLTNRGQPRRPEDWGALRAWGWGASRGLDYLATVPEVDATQVGIEGVSRYGKAALVTMAFDERFAMVLVGSSGMGGAKLHRRNFGEAVENLTGSGEYHWMAGNYLKYGAAESSFGAQTAADLPVDSHQLIALCAPRLTFISYGIPEKGDAHWLDQRGSYMAAVAAGPVFRLLGARDLNVGDDYQTAVPPAVNQGLLEGHLAWRQHDGGHTDGPNIEHFVRWADSLQPVNQPNADSP
jgi:spore coat protein CotH